MMKTQVYTKYTLAHIKLGEECGNLEDVLRNLEEELFVKLIIDSDRILEMVSPMAILFIGGVILSFIMIFIMPVFDGLIR